MDQRRTGQQAVPPLSGDVIELTCSELPLGSLIEVQTCAADEKLDADVIYSPSTNWTEGLTVMGTSADPTDVPPRPIDFLVGSPPRQFPWFKVIMKGTGSSRRPWLPFACGCPRPPYAQYLPAVSWKTRPAGDSSSGSSPSFQATWDGLEAEIDRFPSLADPSAVKPTHLNVLASWGRARPSRTAGPPSIAASSSRHCLGSSSPHANPARTGREARVAGPWAASAITSPQCRRPCRAGSNSKASPS